MVDGFEEREEIQERDWSQPARKQSCQSGRHKEQDSASNMNEQRSGPFSRGHRKARSPAIS